MTSAGGGDEGMTLDLSGDRPIPGELRTFRKTSTTQAAQIGEAFIVDTLEGRMTGQPGDWLAVGVKGERYPIAADVMAASYAEVTE